MTDQQISRTTGDTREQLNAAGRPEHPFSGAARIAPNAPLSRYFDHTLLKPDAEADQYRTLCEEATQLKTRSVCVPPDRVGMCVDLLGGSAVEICTVVGFPLGYQTTSSKVADVETTRALGATEFDMVIPVGRLRDGDCIGVYDDVLAVVTAAEGFLVKVILETALLTDEQKVVAAVASLYAGAAILKTSTGFASAGATLDDLRLFRSIAGESRGVKAAGGIRDYEFARACIAAGADRIGASATKSILAQATGTSGDVEPDGGDGY